VNIPAVDKERKTPKIKKGIAVIGEESHILIGDTPLSERIPNKTPKINIKVSSYYMNNREKFVNFINSIFEPYKRELEENKDNISCDVIGQNSEDFSLLTHQKIVRDYLNLYTPYRGLLLYHGLGSGKTCTSIAIAEGMKDSKKVIIMTPASLRTNYMEELKKCGDLLYKKNQFWEWISSESNLDLIPILSSVLNLSVDYITRKKGAWFINITKRANYSELSPQDKSSLDEQLNEMIRSKYTFINYNGLRNSKLKELTSGFTKNIFDNSVIIIDEAHNLISRIVNKLKLIKGKKDGPPIGVSLKLYEYLLNAKNARVVLLTGTPVINYPNEFGILFNILRGYIKTWQFNLDIKTSNKIDTNSLQKMLLIEKSLDFLEYSPSNKVLTVTRNPFGFKNKIKTESGYQGVSNTKKNASGKEEIETEFVSDESFESNVIKILKKNDISVLPAGVKVFNKKALPDMLEDFEYEYISDVIESKFKNTDSLKRRIIGLSSYFRSAQESLLPRYTKTLGKDFHVIRIKMSNFQFKIYEEARIEERKKEKEGKAKIKKIKNNEIYEEPTSTFKIFSRLFCNFVAPNRPVPKPTKVNVKLPGQLKDYTELYEEAEEIEKNQDLADEEGANGLEGEIEGDVILEKIGGKSYQDDLDAFMKHIWDQSDNFLTKEALKTYSPKYLHILENITDEEYKGLHLVYSQFRTIEGIGVFSLVLEKNGFARFRIKKNASGIWEINIKEDDKGKPTFALYTGTETSEEKEIIRNIYNGDWNYIPTNLSQELKQIANNNNMGEIIKVLMITSSGSEGINLRNTRYVHIMEPYWHPVRMEQVIGRARRICSHKELPLALQTLEVFVYLMIFSEEQLKSEDAKQLKMSDLSKSIPHVPFTSDQTLYEISEIKANVTSQLTDIIKQSAFDCAIYSNGNCFNFANADNTKFSYMPDYSQEQKDTLLQANVKKVELNGKSITISGKEYVRVRVNDRMMNIYDKSSYEYAIQHPGNNPIQIGTLEINERGEKVFKLI
jgi:superfamily II DNA or RNA helicase